MRKGKAIEELVGTTPGKILKVGQDNSIEEADETGGNGIKAIPAIILDETTDLTVGNNKYIFRVPFAFTISEIRANVRTAPSGAAIIIDIKENGTSILANLVSIDSGTKTSTQSNNPPAISDTEIADDSEVSIDINQVGSTTPGAGLKLWFIGTISQNGEEVTIITDGLIFYYKLDENSGAVVDSFGVNNGVNNGATRGVQGIKNNAFNFPGDAYVSAGDLNIDTTDSYSVMCWFKTTVGGQLIARDGSPRTWQFLMGGNGTVRFIRFNSSDSVISNFFTPLSYNDNEWHFAVATFDSSVGSKIYIDGNEVASDTVLTQNRTGLGEPILIGAYDESNLAGFFSGDIDEVRMYDRAITASEVAQLYTNVN